VNSQVNLVPNPGFENVIYCDTMLGSISRGNLPPWDAPSLGSVDGFNACAIGGFDPGFGVPNNNWGYQYPHSGNGYVGGAGYGGFSVPGAGGREYIQVELDSILVAQVMYCGSFYVNLSNKSKLASNNMGMYFSDIHYSGGGYSTLNLIPQINDTNIVSDTAGWTLVSGSFIAQGGEKYIIVGNLYDDVSTDSVHLNGTANMSYYFIDDVDVHRCVQVGVNELGVKSEELSLFPNPAQGELGIRYFDKLSKTELGIKNIKIYDVMGEMVISQLSLVNSKSVSIDVGNLARGIYFVEVETEKGVMRKKFVKE